MTSDHEAGAEALLPPVVRVCTGLPCALAGGAALRDRLAGVLAGALAGRAELSTASCLGRCAEAPAVLAGERAIAPADLAAIVSAVDAGDLAADLPAAPNLVTYTLQGGYRLLRTCLDGRRAPDEIILLLQESGLRGLGGSGRLTAAKWRDVMSRPGPRRLEADAGEPEPGSFKDRAWLEHDPHRFLEGALLAGWAVDAAETVVIVSEAYPDLRLLLAKEVAAAEASGLTDGRPVYLRGDGGPAAAGRPTLRHNAETLYWLRDIIENGAAWWRGFGRRGCSGLRSFSVSGRVRAPGVKVAPAGISARELIEEFCGGMAAGHALHAYCVGGTCLPADLADEPLDFDTLEPHGARLGAAAMVVLSDRDRSELAVNQPQQ